MTAEEIRRRVASPEALAMVIKSLQRSKRLREQAPEWLQKLAEKRRPDISFWTNLGPEVPGNESAWRTVRQNSYEE